MRSTGQEDPCLHVLVALQSVRRARRDLAEAIDRTPATVSSKPLIEGALKLLMGASNALARLAEESGCLDSARAGGGGGSQRPASPSPSPSSQPPAP